MLCISGLLISTYIVRKLPEVKRRKISGTSVSSQAGSGMSVSAIRASLVAQVVKNLPAAQETQVQSLGWEDPLKKEMSPHSSTLAWRIPWREEPGRLQSMGSQSQTRLSNFTFTLPRCQSVKSLKIFSQYSLPSQVFFPCLSKHSLNWHCSFTWQQD